MASIDPASCRVALLAGGTSGEREISLASGKGAGDALRTAGFIVDEYDPCRRDQAAAGFKSVEGALGNGSYE